MLCSPGASAQVAVKTQEAVYAILFYEKVIRPFGLGQRSLTFLAPGTRFFQEGDVEWGTGQDRRQRLGGVGEGRRRVSRELHSPAVQGAGEGWRRGRTQVSFICDRVGDPWSRLFLALYLQSSCYIIPQWGIKWSHISFCQS